MHARALVDKALTLHGLGWTQRRIARECGVSQTAVSHWINGRRRSMPGDGDRGVYCPVCGDGRLAPRAYAYLLGLYLGDGYIGAIRRGVDYLSIVCCDTWPGLMVECATAMAAVFPVTVFQVRRQGCTEIKATSKHWRCVFPQHGPGKKHERRIALESWQREIVDAHPKEFLRGLIHSDGIRVVNRVRRKRPRPGAEFHVYPRYQFTNASSDIVALCTRALDRVGVDWRTHVTRRDREDLRPLHVVSVSRREAVAAMDTFVGPKY
ncbi:helix-turn-helix transcriptional regulator [Nocardiopsis sp. MG754419]|uniref:helix-turn-helix domain-containing protein n=1 Tax=Nocardiopsis sp. MG754419 TaxID=2259865 RepID=UPI001BABD444|nr:helix-turn-helix transcriptional regulator [Nocardiopsis sp. MG754419]MBR8744961.1 transcriptional regulator [Nocardiopsis sp. MG754419]